MINKKTLMAAALGLMACQATMAQANDNGYTFLQVQGGVQAPLDKGSLGKKISPLVGLNVGRWFSPQLGIRLGLDGWQQRQLYQPDPELEGTYEKYNRYSGNIDLLFNLSTIFLPSEDDPRVNVYLLGGLGMVYTDKMDFIAHKSAQMSANIRGGVGAEMRLTNPLSAFLELRFNNYSDPLNANTSLGNIWEAQLALGLQYSIGRTEHFTRTKTQPQQPQPLTLYQQMQKTVEERMKLWTKRMKGEDKTDYKLRMGDENVEAQRLQYVKDVSTEMAGGRIDNTLTSVKYNQNSQTLGLDFTDMPSITLAGVPTTSLPAFANKDNVKFQNTVYEIKPDDTYEVLYTEVLDANGQKYFYRNTQNANTVGAGFLPVADVQQRLMVQQLQQQSAAQTNAVAMADVHEVITEGNTDITVDGKALPGSRDYRVSYTYAVKDGFSAKEDFAPGQYHVAASSAPSSLLAVVRRQMNGKFAPLAKAGATVDIRYTGMADAMPINSAIDYDGSAGRLNNVPVTIGGRQKNITVSQEQGITNNEQLSLVRAASVTKTLQDNVEALKKMKVNNSYDLRLSNSKGGEHRRVTVDFLFHNAL